MLKKLFIIFISVCILFTFTSCKKNTSNDTSSDEFIYIDTKIPVEKSTGNFSNDYENTNGKSKTDSKSSESSSTAKKDKYDEDCLHTKYRDATCERPMVCARCGQTKGEPLGHQYSEATCLENSVCLRCKKIKADSALGHEYENGKCIRCGCVPADMKKALYLGDSISYGEKDDPKGDAWCKRIERDLGIVGTNVSVSGWLLADVTGGPIVKEFDRVPKDNYGYIILQGGVNDVISGKAALGSLTPMGTAKFETSTTAGGLENLFRTAKQLYPYAKIGFIINYKPSIPLADGDNWQNFVNMAKQCCDKWGIKKIYLDETSSFSSEFNGACLDDGLHPNKKGYDVIAKYVEKWIVEL